ncbi:MAG: hypothetical protein M1831_006109 [Alyxoria varia]|nr:MAG: hypothetical protein M1831_006109 [Alyxoria varia]
MIGAHFVEAEAKSINASYIAFGIDHGLGGVVCTPKEDFTVTITPTVTHTIAPQNIFNKISSSSAQFFHEMDMLPVKIETAEPVTVTVTVEHAHHAVAKISTPSEVPVVETSGSEIASALEASPESVAATATRTSTVDVTSGSPYVAQSMPPIFDPCHLTDVNEYAPPCIAQKASKASAGPDGKTTVTYSLEDNTTRTIHATKVVTSIRTVTVVPMAHAPKWTTLSTSSKTATSAPDIQTSEAETSSESPKRTTAATSTAAPIPETSSASATHTSTATSDSPEAQEISSEPPSRTPSGKLSLGPGGWNGTLASPVSPLPLSDWHAEFSGSAAPSGTGAGHTAHVPAHMPWGQ